MSAEAVALIRAIRECPDDDLPRLAYADLLEENGDTDRGVFIRTQVELSRLPEDDPRRRELEDREHNLLAENEAHWLADLLGEPASPGASGLHEWEWERGFVVEVAATPLLMLERGPGLFAEHPVRRWRVMSSQSDLKPDLIEAGRTSWARRLEAVDLSGWYQEIGELERFLTRSDLERLRELNLTGGPGLANLPEILGRSPFRDGLKALRCGGSDTGAYGRLDLWDLAQVLESARLSELAAPGSLLTAGDLRTLLVSPCARELTSLDVHGNDVEPDGHDAFRHTRCRLRELDLSFTPLGAIGLESLLGYESLTELRSLELNGCGSAMANVRAIARSRFWRQAEELRMHTGTVPERALDPIFESPRGPAGLRALDVSVNYLRDAGVEQLCAAEWAGSLAWLGLSQNYLTDDAARTIAASGRFTRLRTLHLSFNHALHQEDAAEHETITDVGAVALAGAPSLANLRLLGLSGTQLAAAGVDAVLNGPHWRLSGLRLARCDLTPEAVRVLAASPRLARLELLDLVHNPRLGRDALMPLAESEYLCPLTELDVRGVSLDDDVRQVLRQRLGRRLSE
jgi:uncharacterized protein (TIGR02996 family)